ncbi:MAG: hypothetical protein R6U95_02790 [Bacteroidales bacterium]
MLQQEDDLNKARPFFEKGEYPVCKAVHVDDKEKHADQPINISTGYVMFGINDIHLIKKMATVRLLTSNRVPEIMSGYFTNKKRFISTRVLW